MKHYKQIIVNLLVDDDCNDEKIEVLSVELEDFVNKQAEERLSEIKEVTVRVNL